MFVSGAAVTPSGVREGDPAALAALATVRGPSVVAYCRQVAGEQNAGPAAAEAFARFRKAVVAAGDTTALNPEALLISATRTAAADYAEVTATGDCAAVPRLLADRADRALPDDHLARLESHLAECWTCRAPVARFKAAERAYRDPPEPQLDPAVAEQILAALAAAVPPPEPEPEPAPVAEATNGAGHLTVLPGGAADPDATQAFTIGQPTTEFQAPGMVEYDPADVAARDVTSEPEPAPAPQRARRGALLSRRGKRGERGRGRPAPGAAAEAAAAAAAEATALAVTPEAVAATPERLIVEPDAAAAMPERFTVEPDARAVATGAPDTVPAMPEAADEPGAPAVATPPPAAPPGAIPYETSEYAPRARGRGRSGRGRRLPIVLPIVVVLLAVLVALFVSGVFGGNEPASSSSITTPAADAAATAPADVVGVPGAKDASGDAVELAKARDRARRRGEPLPEDKPKTKAKAKSKPKTEAKAKAKATPSTTATAQASPPPPPAAATAPPPPPPPPPAAKTSTPKRSSGQTAIDTGSSATGAEQIPPATDTSHIPDLAPPPEP